VPFVHDHIEVRDKPHNLEANARTARYQLLDRLAEENDCPYIATGHHADDQMETLLMSLMRGSGISGMGGMRPIRSISRSHLLRPMLDVRREEIEDLLRRIGLTWHEDPTNADTGFTRNRIRHELLPVLRAFQPDFAVRASNWAQDMQATHDYLNTQVDRVIERGKRQGQCIEWERADLREEHDIILGLLPHRYVELTLARAGLDGLTRSAINAWARSMKSRATDPSAHRIGPIVCYLDAHHVRFEPARAEEGEKGH
jgi:tRNA(Ile)-lysidine synthase TilS/MesJ